MNAENNNQNVIDRLQSTLGKMEIALGAIHDCIVWTDMKGRVQWCNAPFDQLVEQPHLSILGAQITKIFPLNKNGENVPLAYHPYYAVLNGKENFSENYEFGKKLLEIYASQLVMNNKEINSILVIRDITEKVEALKMEQKLQNEKTNAAIEKQKTEELEKAYTASLNIMSDLDKEKKKLQKEITDRQEIEHRLLQLSVSVEQSPNSIVITDHVGMVQYGNPRYYELTGLVPDEVVGQMAAVLKSERWKDVDHKELWKDLREGKVFKGEFLNVHKSGTTFWELVIVSPVRNKQGYTTNFLIISQDITEQKKGEEQMKAALEMKSEFTSTVSHELRTPLASIKGAIDIVMSGTAGPVTPDQEKFLGKAKSNIDRLKRLIDDFLDLSRLESGKIDLDLRMVDVKQIIENVIDIQRPVADKKNLVLRSSLPAVLPKLLCDEDKLNQVFINLVGNAIKFTEKGEVTISFRLNNEANEVEFCVTDTGDGIKKDDIPKLFEKFYQFGDAAKRKTGGTGLGLTICKEIIKQHGGRIWVESQFGRGSRFYFSLPKERNGKNE